MPILEFQKKKRNTALTVRLSQDTITKLKEMASKHDVSQADVLERLIEIGYAEMNATSKRKSSK